MKKEGLAAEIKATQLQQISTFHVSVLEANSKGLERSRQPQVQINAISDDRTSQKVTSHF